METQFSRFINDAESEKETRRRSRTETNEKIDRVDDSLEKACTRITSLEKKIWIGVGGLSVLQFVIMALLAFKK